MTKIIKNIDMNKFKKYSDKTVVGDIADYIKTYIESHEDDNIKLFIGTDSQNIRKNRITVYGCVICIYRVGKGGHILYHKFERNDIKDRFNRLWWEVEYSMQIANFLKDKNIYLKQNLLEIHIDLSPNVNNGSNNVYNSAKGYITGMGYEVHAKPHAQISSYAADMVCRN